MPAGAPRHDASENSESTHFMQMQHMHIEPPLQSNWFSVSGKGGRARIASHCRLHQGRILADNSRQLTRQLEIGCNSPHTLLANSTHAYKTVWLRAGGETLRSIVILLQD